MAASDKSKKGVSKDKPNSNRLQSGFLKVGIVAAISAVFGVVVFSLPSENQSDIALSQSSTDPTLIGQQNLVTNTGSASTRIDPKPVVLIPFEDSLAGNGIEHPVDPERPWLQDSLRKRPFSEYWVNQVNAHLAQERTPGWLKFENYQIQQGRDPLQLPTFDRMAASDHIPGVITVRIAEGVDTFTALSDIGLVHKQALNPALPEARIHVYALPENMPMREAVEVVNAHHNVAYAEPDYKIEWALAPNESNGGISSGNAWWLNQINAYEAWDTITDATAIGPIAVYDQGILRSHEDLQGNFWVNPDEIAGNGVDDDNNGIVDDINGRTNRVFGGHGTPVAGTICGRGDNGIGYVGSAWRCQLMDTGGPLSFSAAVSDAMASLLYATNKGSRLSNHSWGIRNDYSQAFKDVITQIADDDHLMVIASHNFNSNIDAAPVYPASYDNENILSIAASNQSEGRISYSNYGRTSVDIAAPTEFNTANSSGGYSGFSGTSQATPVVTGIVGLAWSMDPSMTYREIKQLVLDTARPVSAWRGLTVSEGIIDMKRLVESVIVDTDGDGILDDVDTDDDNDGVLDVDDAFPKDPEESVDTDGDGIGNNADRDDDGDGVNDEDDWRPLDPNEQYDTDGDGIGNSQDTDDDNDGVSDEDDAFPLDPEETTDSDNDGVGDNTDVFPNDPNETTDSDGDGVGDNGDVDRDNDGLSDTLESRVQADIVDWPVLTGNAAFNEGVLTANGGSWGYQANSARFSSYGFTDNYRFQFNVNATGTYNMIGLGSVESSASYTDIDFAFYLVNSTLYAYENGASIGTIGTVAVGDTLAIEVKEGVVTYLRNDNPIRTVNLGGETPDYYVDSSFYSGAIRLSALQVVPIEGAGISADADNDGYANDVDLDSDNDTIPDVIEAGLADEDGNLTVDSIDLQASVDPAPDSDNDGIPDFLDLESRNAANDGTAFDMHGYHFAAFDTNGDGMLNLQDGEGGGDVNQNGVDDRAEDSDGDGISNPNDEDDDNDGTLDIYDAFPFDPNEDTDTDGDGVGDNGDAFPTDSSETKDTDGDGVGDNADAFPEDDAETKDSDGDGVGDNADVFPNDASETHDADGDGIGDNADIDRDNDGLSDELELRSDADIVDWPVLTGNAAYNEGQLTANGGSWGYQANSARLSTYGFDNNYRFEFNVDATGTYNMIGLGSVESSASYTDIDFAFYLVNTTLYVYENGSSRGSIGSVAVGDTLSIEVTPSAVSYLRNNDVLRTVNVSGDTPDYYVDTSFYSGAIRLSGLKVVPNQGGGRSADADTDGVTNDLDLDSDNDTIPDVIEAGLADSDGNLMVDQNNLQGTVNPAPDTDNDGIPDYLDLESNNPENDGTAFDMHGYDFAAFDTNGDGMLTQQDGEGGADVNGNGVDDRAEDSDGDGISNPNDEDDDNDGTLDIYDAFPFDPNEDTDTDGDGVGDNADAFPTDDSETKDTDGDGVGDNADVFPEDASETKDTDGDGVGDNADVFPNDATETKDADNDGIGDNADIDRDNDGLSDELELRTEAEIVDWPTLYGSSFSNGELSANGGTWRYQANSARFSEYGYSDNYRLNFKVVSLGANNMFGLGNVESGAYYSDIDYAFYIVNSYLYLYESGSYITNFGSGSVAVGDVLSIEVNNGNITYRRNDDVLRETTYNGDTPDFYVDSSFYNGAIRLTDIKLTPASGSGFAVDADNDGVANDLDLDSDNDTIPDVVEAGLADADGDLMVDQNNLQGTVNPAPDTDNDGIPDYLDLESNNPENDGTAFDMHGYHFAAFDTNGDGMLTQQDGEGGADVNGNGVDDRAEDSDGDGISNPNDEDDDNDGTLDIYDAFPFDPNEDTDTDGDGVGDNADAFPTDDTETKDADGDGVGDNADVFPEDASETKDTDGDGVGDNADVFPDDATETKDADNDGIGDNADIDRDNDGLSDELELRTEAEIVDWPVLYGSSFSNGELSANGGTWRYQANSARFSEYGYSDNYRLNFKVVSLGGNNMFGLGNVESGAYYSDIDYAFYIVNSYLYLYESGSYITNFGSGSVAVGDVLSIEVSNGNITYRRNDDVLRETTYSGDTPDFYVDSSFYNGAIRLTDIKLMPASGSGFAVDADNDGVANDLDLDSDNDTIPDVVEAGLADADGDLMVDQNNLQGTVNPAPDTDNDGIPDYLDLESNNPENDGTAFDMHGYDFAAFDTNGDGMLTQQDGEGGADVNGNGVDDRAEDSDGDGISNPNDEDDDNDGTLDIYDAFPFDPNEDTDTDGDGVGDNADAFPTDDTETKDTDGDGVGDNADVFPEDASETKDTDGDGVGDNADVFPDDATETKDADNDGIGDNADIDRDNDGLSDELELRTEAEIVDWPVLYGSSFSNGELSANGGTWRYQANSARFSEYGYSDNYRLNFKVVSLGANNMFGLGNVESGAYYSDIDYAFYIVNSYLYLYESGSYITNFGSGSVAVGDVLSIEVNNGNITYRRNDDVLRETTYSGDTPDFYVDSSFYNGAIRLTDIKLTPASGSGFAVDADNDGVANDLDLDSDNDTIPDVVEAGLADADGDLMVDQNNLQGTVNPAPDSDGDGIPDYLDLESNNPENDGTAFDMHGYDFAAFDTNGDGMLTQQDGEGGADVNGNGVDDRAEDSDGDGISNPNDEDDDNDGTLDIYDAFPFDPNEDTDTDGDGVGDNADAFPTDDSETKDTDGDGVGDNADVFPEDASETKDTDGDGVGDNADVFPNDATETKDADNDGIGDNADIDRDNDGLSDELELRTEAAITDWPTLYGSSFSNGELSANGGTWRYQANSARFSEYGYSDNYRLNFKVVSLGANNMFGLGNVESGAYYSDIDYAFYIVNSYLYLYESGSYITNFGSGSVAVGDVLSIEVNNGNITYRRNDDVLRETTYSGETPDFYVDSSFYNGAIRLTDIKLTPASGSGFAVDADNDGVPNDLDLDSDNDTIPDVVEAGLSDSDGDLMVDQNNLQGTVNPAPDTDNDGIPDYLDLESNNPENDGTAFDMHGYDFAAFDTNGDGMLTQQDGEGGADVNGNGVDDRAEDSDGDGLSNPNDEDDDNDGTIDIYDAFPFDPNEDTDTDGDGVGDNADAFPTDDSETKDTDGDGVGDNADVFPEDASETKDTDGDGVGDNADDFPNDANETTDADMDGVGDNADIDRDNDGLSDELELRTEAAITDWPVLYGSSYSNGELSANGGSWTYQANSKRFSEYGYRDNYRLSFTVAAPGTYNMFGLGNAESSASYTDIDYAFYIAGSYIYIYERGTSRSWFAQIAVGDVLSIEVNNGSIAYYHNQDLLRSVTYSGETPDFYVDTSFYSGAIRLTDIKLTPASGAVLNTDADSDGYANDRDLDSDNDTIPDIVEAGLTDRDGDMQVDYIFQQGIVSPAPDSDGDGIPDFLDLESLNAANDGTDYDMHRFIYAQYDTNGDGMLNQQDGEGGADTNNNGVDDRAEDADRDGVLNGNDDDDDNDGARDLDDALPFDPNETRDSDGDGVGDNADAFPNDDSESKDTDGDGVGNNVDLDNDNDGVSDLVESHADVAITRWPVLVGNARYGDGKLSANGGSWTHQANSDRFSTFGFRRDYQFSFVLNQLGTYNMVGLGDQETSASYTDIDFAFYFVGSTIYIYENGSSRGTFGTATVGDTFAIKVSDTGISYLQNGNVLREVNIAQTEVDYYVDTSFYSGAFEIGNMKLSRLSTTSLSDDMDGDGIPNALDLDSDNDAIPDLIEVGLPDANGDLKVDTADLEGSVTAPQDSDNDGIPDYLDLESLNPSNDGTAYDIDNSGYSFFDANGDGMLDGDDEFGADGNGNGMADIAEAAGS